MLRAHTAAFSTETKWCCARTAEVEQEVAVEKENAGGDREGGREWVKGKVTATANIPAEKLEY